MALDLFKNGIYLPFLITSTKNSWNVDINHPSIINKTASLVLGFHRAYALCTHKTIDLNKKFLLLDIGSYDKNVVNAITTYKRNIFNANGICSFLSEVLVDENQINKNLWDYQEMISNYNNGLSVPII